MWGIIPAAGAGSRIQPLAFSKELLPVGSRVEDGVERPRAVSEYLVERMIAAGADKLCFVIAPGKTDILEYYGSRLWGADIAYVVQPAPGGLCDAVFRARPLIAESESVVIGLPDTIWLPEDGLRALPESGLSLLLFPVERPEFFDAVITDAHGAVQEIQVKRRDAATPWIWGAIRMPGSVFHALHSLWRQPERRDEYLGSLINGWLAQGGSAAGIRAGRHYVDVGSVHGYREALHVLQEDNMGSPATSGRADEPIAVEIPAMPAEKRSLEEKIAALGPWFQNLRLHGIQTAPHHFLGDYPEVKFARFRDALPQDLSGRTVLDIGCNAGFYSLEMKRRGATHVLGIDTDDRYLRQARFAARTEGIDVEFRRMSVWQIADLGCKFDLVVFMGVLYHLRHPLLALDLIHEHVAGDLLLFQSMQRGSRDVIDVDPDYDFTERALFDRPAFPRLHFIEQRYSNDETNWWVPNRACVEAMLRSSGFSIQSHPEEEVYLCRWKPVEVPPDGPHTVYPSRGGARAATQTESVVPAATVSGGADLRKA